jgi:hypothetical protein
MKTIRAVALLLAAVCAWPSSAQGQENGDLVRQQESLSSEYGLARAPSFYFVLDVAGRKLELRVRGMALRSWPLSSLRFWGKPAFQGNVELKEKSALKTPERIVIRPAEAGEQDEGPKEEGAGEFDVEALELKDMPESFRLEFDNGLNVYVRSSGGSAGGLGGRLWSSWRWYFWLPVRSFIGWGKGNERSWLELTFEDKRDAQAIYWHFFKGIRGIII